MKWQHTDRSKRDYEDAPSKVKKAFDKQARVLDGHGNQHAVRLQETIHLVPGVNSEEPAGLSRGKLAGTHTFHGQRFENGARQITCVPQPSAGPDLREVPA